MSRIQLRDTLADVVTKMSEGNPGALDAMSRIIKEHNAIDPQAAMGGMGAILLLDTWEIYGTAIYILFNDKCDRDIRRMLVLMRATQLGFFPSNRLKEMAADQMRQVNLTEEEWADLDKEVCEALKEFARPPIKDQEE